MSLTFYPSVAATITVVHTSPFLFPEFELVTEPEQFGGKDELTVDVEDSETNPTDNGTCMKIPPQTHPQRLDHHFKEAVFDTSFACISFSQTWMKMNLRTWPFMKLRTAKWFRSLNRGHL